MAKLVLIALAATAAAAPLGAQTVGDPGPGYGPPPVRMNAPPGVSWREQAPPPPMIRRAPMGNYAAPPQAPGAPQVRTRTWTQNVPPPPPGHGDGPHGGMHMMPPPGGHPGMDMHGYRPGRPGEHRRVEVRRYHRGPAVGWGGGYAEGWGGGYGYEGAPLPPPPPCAGPCGGPPPPPPMPYGYGYGYGYGGGGTVVVTETTVTEAPPVVERRTYYTTVRERVRVVKRHHVVRCRCKLVKARPRAGERG